MNHYDNKTKRALAVYIFIFLLLVTGIAIGGHFSYANFEQEFHRQAGNQVSAIAELKENSLVGWRRERLVDAQSFYRNSVFSGLVERYFENPADVKTKNQIISRLEFYQSFAQYDAVCLLDVTGIHRLVIPANSEEFKKADVLLMADAASSLDSGNVIFGDFQRDPNVEGKIYISILVPLFAEQSDGRPLGVLVFHVKPETYLYPYINQWPIPSDTAETLLVRRDGEDVLFLSQLRFEQDAELNLRFPLTRTDLPAAKAVLGQTGLVEGVDYRGKQVLADVRAVPDSPWFLISKVDVDEVYAPLRERLWQTLTIVGMAILVAGTGLALVWRQQRVLFYRTQVEATEALRASEEKFRKAFTLSPDSININRLHDGMYVSINNGFTKITGHTADEVIGKTSLETDIWADPQDRKKLVEGLEKSGEVANLEMRFRMKNGEIRQGLMSASVLELNGTPHIISITRDISERKLADEKMRQAQLVLENSSVVLFRWKAVSGWLVELVSENISQFGYRPEEFLSGAMPYASFIHPDDLERVGREVSEYSANGVDRFQQQYRIVTRDGQVRWTDDQTMIERDTQGNITHYQGTIMDITERKQAEDALRQSEENLSTTLHSIGDGVISTDKDGLIASMNPAAEKYCGWTLADAKGKPLTKVFNIINAETRKRVENPVARVMESGQIAGLANHTVLISKNGREYQIADSAAPIKNKNGEITGVVLAFSDVTEKYKAEQILRESEESFVDIFQTVSEGIAYTTLGGQVLSINKSLEKILEIPQEQIVGKNILSLAKELLSTENIKKAVPVLVNLVQGREIQPFEIEYKNKIIELTATINKASGRLTGVIRDITERKQAEDALLASEQMLHNILENFPGVVFWKDTQSTYLGCNQSFAVGAGLNSSVEIIGKTDFDLPWSTTEAANYRADDCEVMQSGKAKLHIVETQHQSENRLTWFDTSKIPLRDSNGQVMGVFGVATDITERKRAEEALRENEEKYRRLFDNAPLGIFQSTPDGKIISINSAFAQMLGYDSSDDAIESIKNISTDIFADPNRRAEIIRLMSENPDLRTFENVYRRKDGSTFIGNLNVTPVRDADGQLIRMEGIVEDITERKQAEEALRAAEKNYRDIFENAMEAFTQTTPGENILL